MGTIKKSSTRRMPSGLVEKIQSENQEICADIEKQYTRIKAFASLKNTRHASRWKAGTCKICGEYMEYCITNYHARLHGYKSAEALIKAGKVIFD